MTKRHIIIATRESPLALRQTEGVRDRLQAIHPHLSIEFLGITTQADKMLDISLTEVGGKGLFVKELEEALLDGRADIAVHSMKDVPMDLPPGLKIPIVCQREEVRDVFVSNLYGSLFQVQSGGSIGTSSLRRKTQLRALRSNLIYNDLRGNINTRLHRLDQGNFDGIILAAAGLKRLQLSNRIRAYFSMEEILPAAGQGALGIECREEDETILTLIKPLNHEGSQRCVTAERAVSRRLGGGCTAPIAAYAEIHHDVLTLRALVASRNGMRILKSKLEGDPRHAESIGIRVAEELLQQGAEKVLAQ